MLFTSTLAIGASLLSLSEAIALHKRTDGPARTVQLDTHRKRTTFSAPVRDRLRKRSKTLNVQLLNEQTLYFANVSIGTPAQSLHLDIDTGSSDLWANSADSNLCQSNGNYCAASGTYNANDSSTYTYVNSDFLIKYADGSYASGDYAKDTVTLGGTALTNVQFGIGYDSTSPQGILGVGYMTNEASIATTGKTYTNVPAQMVADGVIAANAYSLWLNDLDANTGSILFGGVDTDKYHGDLSTVPVIKENGVYQEFVIALTGLTAGGQEVSNTPIAVLLDSGSSLTYLPDSTAQSLYTIFSATYDSQAGAATVDCSLANNAATVDFSFSGINISVPMNELVIVDAVERGREICILGITSAGSSTSVLGDTFLRSAYVVYDLDNNEISLAQTNFNATSSNVQEIAAGSSGVPNATPVASPVTNLAVGTGGARNGGNPSVTAVGAAAKATAPPAVMGGVVAAAAAGIAMAL
ncbi:uncharacterized protein PV09_09631 [Verruconis gallopava]|uniref:Probable aspartic-type endopeptidase OPSB n=1 Tax=Verruconis gallopava TaxID=253628 RepID=A0A0D1ZX30_9PEZI|nr:uncharacterized protein PV09_09631 [Verruconis gallopava]KIV98584.1 hypothetical protein PV09_09631 [Verruconis gallopava]